MRLARREWDGVLTRDFKLTPLLTRLGLDVVHEWHSVPSALGQGSEGEGRAAAAAVAHVFVSRGLREFVDRRFGVAGPTLVLPNGCFLDDAAARRRLQDLPNATDVVVAGLFRQPTDVRVLATLAGHLPADLRLVVAGDAPAECRQAEGVRALGTVPPARIPSLLDGALCQLALYGEDLNTETFASPMKVVGAMGSGVPLVATDLPTVRDLTGSDALLVPPGDTTAAADAVRRLHGDRGLARRLADDALRRAAALDWQQRGAHLLDFLRSLGG